MTSPTTYQIKQKYGNGINTITLHADGKWTLVDSCYPDDVEVISHAEAISTLRRAGVDVSRIDPMTSLHTTYGG